MLVSANFDLPQNERTALLVKPDPAEKVMIQVRQTIEDFFGLPDGQCRMI
jgi:hypothetical protein